MFSNLSRCTILVVAFILLRVATSFGQPPQPGPELDLTPEQKEQVARIVAAHRDTIRALSMEILETRLEARDEKDKEQPDRQKISHFRDKIVSLKRNLRSAIGARNNEIRRILTDRQKEIWDRRLGRRDKSTGA